MARRLIKRGFRRRFFRWYWLRLKRRIRFHYLGVLRSQATPHKIALGLAIGTVAGLLPIVPFQTITSLILCFIFRGNFMVSLPAIQITNPLTIPPFYYLFFKIGQAVSNYGHEGDLPPIAELVQKDPRLLWAHFSDAFMAMMVGGLILSAIFAPAAYIFVRRRLGTLRTREYVKVRIRLDLARNNRNAE